VAWAVIGGTAVRIDEPKMWAMDGVVPKLTALVVIVSAWQIFDLD
jgi:hypothetical protein